MELANLIDQCHEPVKLAEIIDWEAIDNRSGGVYVDRRGCPGIPTRLMAGLLNLKATFKLSDEDDVRWWVENPYWQFLSAEKYSQHRLPIHPTSLTRFRKHIGEKGCKFLLSVTVVAGLDSGTVKEDDFSEVVIDTTVM